MSPQARRILIVSLAAFVLFTGLPRSVDAQDSPAPEDPTILENPNQHPQSIPDASLSVNALLVQVDQDRLWDHIVALQGFQTRHVNSIQAPYSYDNPDPKWGITAAYGYIMSQFEDIEQNAPPGNFIYFPMGFNLQGGDEANNIVAIIADTEYDAGTIVIGAHYDSINMASNSINANAPGANDDASGVAALIELARILSVRPHHMRIVLVAFSGEEVGRLGSIAFVRNFIQAPERHVALKAMINLDIIGSSTGPNGARDDNHVRLFSAGPDNSVSRQLARTIQLIGHHYIPDMEIVVQDSVDRPGRWVDHMSFSDEGLPAVRFIENIEETNRQHTTSDTTNDIQGPFLAKVTKTVLVVVTVLADGPNSPLSVNLSGDSSTTCALSWDAQSGAARYLVAVRSAGSMVYDQEFETNTPALAMDCRADGWVIASVDASGLMGLPSPEFSFSA